MADIDPLVAIVSLALIGGGAGYFLWQRRARPSEEPATALPTGRERNAETMPPTLRPDSEIPAKMAAKKEALARASGKPPAASERKVSAAKVETAASSAAPASTSKSAPPAHAAGVGSKSNVAVASAPVEAPAAAPRSAAPASAAGPAAKSKSGAPSAPKSAAPASAKNAVGSASAAPQPSSKGAPAKAKAASKARAKAKDDGIDVEIEGTKAGPGVPSLAHDEDDVELTRVGEGQENPPIRPLVEKILFDEGADTPPDGADADTVLVYAVGQTDTGRRRKENQDAYLLVDRDSLFIVADGMGGHRGGQVASKLAVSTIEKAFAKRKFEAAPHDNIATEASELARAVQMANTAIFLEAKDNPDLEGMGTTVVAARFTANRRRLYIAHVGDSRCYRLRNGVMRPMTSDHTMADYGVTGPEGAHLSRAVGVWPTVPIDIVMAIPEVGDLYLLCSDGLTKMVSEQTIAAQLLHEEDPRAAVSRLILFANSHGGKDNSTVVLLRVVPPGWKPASASLPPPAAT